MVEHLLRVETTVAVTELLDRFGGLEGATAAAAHVKPAEQGSLSARIYLEHVAQGGLRGNGCCDRSHVVSDAEEFLDFAQDFDKTVDFLFGVIEIETGAGRGLNTEFMHEGLVAMMAPAQSHTALVGDCDDVMRVNVLEQETDHAGPSDMRAK
jgi:hypothetical protein